MRRLIQGAVSGLLVFVGSLTAAHACHEEKNNMLSGHKDKFSINLTTVSTEAALAFTSTTFSCDAYASFLHQKYDQVAENAAQGEGPYLNVIAAFQGCPTRWHPEFGLTLKARYGEVFDETSRQEPKVLMGRIQQVIESHPQLQQACNEV